VGLASIILESRPGAVAAAMAAKDREAAQAFHARFGGELLPVA
jgi:hypothetical protein